ncbi:hypothetical protein PSAB6_10256 [Paraburkholderia sabiae]|nr:hypothetical protein PSAB6_10256 [Paraburkholderia sabiae]
MSNPVERASNDEAFFSHFVDSRAATGNSFSAFMRFGFVLDSYVANRLQCGINLLS